MDLHVTIYLCLMTGIGLGQVQIQNPTLSATLNQLQPTDVCVYPLTVTPDPHTCSQNITNVALFAVQKRTGDPDFCVYYLSANGPPTLPSYRVEFSCLDSSDNIDHSYVQIDVIPDSPPVFTEGAAISKTVDALTVKTGNTLFPSLVTDPNGDALIFSLDPTSPAFEIDPPTGNVNAKVNFDTLSTTPYSFKIQVTDGQTMVEQQVTLNLNNLNTAPTITNLPTTLTIPEDVAPGVALYTCTHDEPGAVTITLDVNPVTERATFNLNPTTCTISVAAGQKLDFEATNSMTMTLVLNDGVLSSTFSFALNVLDRNDPPAFTSTTYTMNIPEGPVPVTPAIQPAFTVTDEDAGESHTFAMGTGTYDSFFAINSGTGALQNIKEIDFDAGLTQVPVTVIVTDKGGDTATATVTVNVADFNDNDPEYAVTNTDLFISPKTPVGSIGQVTATDKDTGVNAALTYSLQADNSGGRFLVQPDGSVYLQTAVTEAQRNDIYTLTVRATDGGTPPRSADTTVTVQFNVPPVITNLPNSAFLSEDTSTKTEVFQIQVTETDTYGCEADQVLPVTPNTAFVVEKKTGGQDSFVFYTGLQSLSFATIPSFTVDVICTDSHDGKSIKSTLTVNIRQNTPPNLNCNPNLIGVDASVANVGDTVHTMVATDDDTLTLQMTVSPNPGTFTILDTGVIQCQRLMIRETVSQYTGVVTASDPFNTVTCTITFTMTNTNQAPVFQDLPRAVEVAEDLAAGAVIAQVTIEDTQQCTTLSFTWEVVPDTDRLKFNAALVNKVVTLTVANGQKLDRETIDKYTFSFRAKDGCLDSQLYPLYVEVTDVNEKPEFLNGQNYIANFDEVNSPGVNLNCGGIDPDIGDAHTLVLEGADANKFTIVDTAQCILGQAAELDRDNNGPAQITLTMKLIDTTGLSATATVTVFVREVNDNDPVCTSPAYNFGNIYNGDTIGRSLGTVAATDEDQSVNGQVTFGFASGSSGSGVLGIASDGNVKLVGDPDGKLAPGALVDLTVQATDRGSPPRSTTCAVNVQYVYTTTPPPPSTMPPATGATGGAGVTGGAGGAGGTGSATTLSPVDAALQNPVILGLIAALAALLLLGLLAGVVLCCKGGSCKGGQGSKNYDFKRDQVPSRGRGSPKSNQVSNRVTTVSEVTPAMHDGPTTFKYL